MVTSNGRRRRRVSAAGMFVVIMTGALALLVLLRAVHTVAQEGLPTPEGRLGGAISIPTQPPARETRTPTPVVRLDIPDPDLCDVEPRTVDGMLSVVGTPEALPAAGATPMVGDQASTGEATDRALLPTAAATTDRAASAAIVGQIQRAVREIIACGNAGDLLRVWAYFSDEFIRSSAERQPALFNSTILTARAQAQAPRNDAMPRVSSVRMLSDDRVSATVVIPTASPLAVATGRLGTVTLVFVLVDSAWLVDEVRESDGTGV